MSANDLETKVHAVLTTRAAGVGSDAIERLQGATFEPRVRRARIGMVGGCAVAASASAVSALVLIGSAAPAYAGWTPRPMAIAKAPSAAASSSCEGQLASLPGSSSSERQWRVVLTDVRGPFTAALYRSGTSYAVCLTSTSMTEIDRLAPHGMAAVSVTQSGPGNSPTETNATIHMLTTASGSLSDVTQSQFSATTAGPYTLVDGTAAAGITGVTLVRSDGQDVSASVGDGWFMAWWPGDAIASSAQIVSASGTTTEELTPMPVTAQSGNGPGGSITCTTLPSVNTNTVVRSLGVSSTCTTHS